MDLTIRAVALLCFVFLITRIIGRRELSSLEPFDLILLIVVGDAIQQGLAQDDYSVTGAQDGRAIEKNMKRERITLEEVMVEARLQQVASLGDIAWAVLETSGKVSIIPRR
jgi:uncharacterized membrane protein YcaP (DUF421 family)